MKKIITTLLISLGIVIPFFFLSAAVGTIDPTYKYAWANKIGWINFGCDDCDVSVTDTALTGYAWAENLGWINLSPVGGGGVLNTTAGNLSGSAWGEDTGWIDFDNVSINSSGQFTGTATGDVVGTVVFSDCGSGCGVKTDWLPVGGDEPLDPPGSYGGSPSYHNVCSNNQCLAVAGAGLNMCQSNQDCTSTHTECQNQQCISVSGNGINQCGGDNECILPKHNVCQNNQCILIDGAGSNLCQTAQDCTFSHSICQNQQCLFVSGVGVNQCQSNANCVTPKHNICQNQQCITVDGAGLNSCQNNADCGQPPVVMPKHNVCQNNQCVLVDGEGAGSCQSDVDCQSALPGPDEPPLQIPPIITEVLTNPIKTIESAFTGANNFIKTAEGAIVTTTVSTVGVMGGLLTTLSLAVFAPGVIFEVVFIPLRLASLLMAVTGIRRKIIHWGIVYDSATKQPLDPVRVSLSTLDGKEIASTITDVDGRYGFLVDKGVYTISAQKTHYDFPSKKLMGKVKDEIYEDLYFGEKIEVLAKGDVIKKNIPLDSLGFDWNEFAKSHKHLTRFYSKFDASTKTIADIIFGVGFVVSVWAYFNVPAPYNLAIVILYFALLALRLFVFKPKSFGHVVKKEDGQPLSYAILRIISASVNIEVGHKISDAFGRYYCLIPKGKYYVKVQEKLPDGTYKEVYTSGIIDATRKGIIKTSFKV